MLTSVTLNASAGFDAAAISGVAERLDRAGCDMLLLGGSQPWLDPLVVAGWLAPRVRNAGLVAHTAALHTRPFHIARALSALDILTQGRMGWAPTTIGHAAQARRFGPMALTPDGEVVPKGLDFIAATRRLWETWDVNALIIDKAAGVYLDSDKVRRVHYRGPYFQVMGPLNAARPPQGYPVLVQRDDDPLWRVTAEHTDVLLVAPVNVGLLEDYRMVFKNKGSYARFLIRVEVDGSTALKSSVSTLQPHLDDGSLDGVSFEPTSPSAMAEIIAFFDTSRWAPRGGDGTLRAKLGLPDLGSGPAWMLRTEQAA